MPALMPRCTECVLCGGPIQGKGRIDRIYCSASCRTLAWRARSGDRWAGRRKSRSPQPGSYVARIALPLLAVRMKAELDAAKRRIAELERQTNGGAEGAASTVASVAAAGAAVAVAVTSHRTPRMSELERVRAEAQAEQERHRAELAAIREQAAAREATLDSQVATLTKRCEQAEQKVGQAAAALDSLTRQTESLRHDLAENTEQHQQTRWELGLERGKLMQAQHALQRYETARKTQGAQCASLQEQLTATQWQLAHEQEAGQEMRARLASGPWQTLHRLDEENQQLRGLLTQSETRAATAERALTSVTAEVVQQERLLKKRVEKVRLKLEARHQKQLAQVVEELKRLPVPSTLWERIVTAASGLAVGTIASVVRAKVLSRGSERKVLPPKRAGAYLEGSPALERKRLPPKRDQD